MSSRSAAGLGASFWDACENGDEQRYVRVVDNMGKFGGDDGSRDGQYIPW